MKKRLTLKKIVKVSFTSAFVFVGLAGIGNLNGPPGGQTGAPGESNCTSCHTGGVITSGANWSNITFTSNIPACGYTAGQTYSITLTHTQTGINRMGFQMTALGPGNVAAGSFTSGSGNQTLSLSGRNYVEHTSSGTTASGGTNSWSFSWTAPSSGVGNITFYAAVNATNADNNSTGDQIYTKSFSFIQAGGAPTAVITANPTTVCVGDTVYFSASGCNNPTGYTWAFTNVATPALSNQQAPKVVYNVAGTFNVSLQTSNTSGSSPFTSKQIIVMAKPSSTVTPSGNITLCGNDSVTLSAPVGGGLTYLWSPGNETTSSIKVKTTGTYNVKVTNANNCSSTSANINVTARSLPVVTISSSADSICQGDTVTFTGSGSFSTYRFLRDTQTMQNTPQSTFHATSLNSAHVFKVIAMDSFGCKSLPSNGKSILVRTPLAAPVVSCGTSTTSSVQFNWTAVPGAVGYEICADSGKTWLPPSTGSTGLSHTISGLPGGVYIQLRVRALQSGSVCAHGLAAISTCQTTGCPKVSFKYTGSKYSCLQSDTDSSTHNFALGDIAALKYAVNINNKGYAAGTSFPVTTYKGANSVNVKIIDSLNLGCPITDSNIVVTGVNSPSAKPTLSFDGSNFDTIKQFCDNAYHTLFSSQPAGAHRYLFIRNFTDTIQDGFVHDFTSVSSPKKYNNNDLATVITVDTVVGCFKVSDPVKVKLLPAPVAAFTQYSDGPKAYFTDGSTGKIKSWSWSFGSGSGASTLQHPDFTYPAPGIYSVTLTVTDSNTCQSSFTRQLLLFTTGTKEVKVARSFSLYPNPADDHVTISFENNSDTWVNIHLYDMNGREVYLSAGEQTGTGLYTHRISVEGLPVGAYMMMIRAGDDQKLIRFVKE